MHSRFIDQFEVILLDMAHTFMFNVDRFSDDEDFAATYQQIGGRALSTNKVRQILKSLFATIESDYQDPRFIECFPSVCSYLETQASSRSLPRNELDLLEQVFALHEVGKIPEAYAETLCQLRKTHRLGVVSDIWSRSDLFLQEFDRVGIRELFDVIVFSSDHGCVKPSSQLFRKALDAFAVDRTRLIFVGDSLQRDVAGAKAVGLATVWVNAAGAAPVEERLKPDCLIRELLELCER